MQMMYETIYKALVEVGLEDAFSPQDFLNFYCLGNREAVDEFNSSGMPTPSSSPIPQVSSFLKSVVSFMLCILQCLVLWEMRNLLVQNEFAAIWWFCHFLLLFPYLLLYEQGQMLVHLWPSKFFRFSPAVSLLNNVLYCGISRHFVRKAGGSWFMFIRKGW